MKVEATVMGLKLPLGAKVGDQFGVKGTARIAGIVYDLVDVSSNREGEEFIPGDCEVTLLLTLDAISMMGEPA
jgi:hypothetical protein